MKGLIAAVSALTLGVAAAVTLIGDAAPASVPGDHHLDAIGQRLAAQERLLVEGRDNGLLSPREMFILRTEQRTIQGLYADLRARRSHAPADRTALNARLNEAEQNIVRLRANDEKGRSNRPRPFAGVFY
jgi:hypothetical protein